MYRRPVVSGQWVKLPESSVDRRRRYSVHDVAGCRIVAVVTGCDGVGVVSDDGVGCVR